MLAAARKSDFGGELLGGQALDTFRTMQDEHFADLAAQSGAFGFGKLIEAQLIRNLAPGASTGSARAGLGNFPDSNPAQPEPVEGPSVKRTGP
jgi:peptidoglycan hydrolase FlgJ